MFCCFLSVWVCLFGFCFFSLFFLSVFCWFYLYIKYVVVCFFLSGCFVCFVLWGRFCLLFFYLFVFVLFCCFIFLFLFFACFVLLLFSCCWLFGWDAWLTCLFVCLFQGTPRDLCVAKPSSLTHHPELDPLHCLSASQRSASKALWHSIADFSILHINQLWNERLMIQLMICINVVIDIFSVA